VGNAVLAASGGIITKQQRARTAAAFADNAALRDYLAAELVGAATKGAAPPQMFFHPDELEVALAQAFRGNVAAKGDTAGVLALLKGAASDKERSAIIGLLARQKAEQKPLDLVAVKHALDELRSAGVFSKPAKEILPHAKSAPEVKLELITPLGLGEKVKAVPVRADRAAAFDAAFAKKLGEKDVAFDKAYGDAIEKVTGTRVTRAALETALAPPIEGFTAEVTSVQGGDHGGFTVSYEIRDASGKIIGVGEQGAYREADGHLIWDLAILSLDRRYQAGGMAQLLVDQSVLTLGKLTKNDPAAEVRLLANISVGVYAWAKDFDFANPRQRENMLKDFDLWLDTQAKDKGGPFTNAEIAEHKKRARDFKTPARFAAFGLMDGDPKVKMNVTQKSYKEVNAKEAHPGKAFLLTGARAWDASLKPFAPRETTNG
jgi:hypothetical protein